MDNDQSQDTPREPTEVCTLCRQAVPLQKITMLMSRPVCLDCAAVLFEEEEDES